MELLLRLGHSVEVCCCLTPGHLLEPVALLELLPGPLDLQPPLPLLLLSNPLLLPHLLLPHQLVGDDLGQSLQIELNEHVESVLLSVLGQAGELALAELLQLGTEGQVLLVKLLLLAPGQSLPRSGVCEGGETQLLVLQLLGDGQSLSGGEDEGVGVAEVDVTKMSNESLSLLAGQPRWWGRSGGGGGGGSSCGGGGAGGSGRLRGWDGLSRCGDWQSSGDLSLYHRVSQPGDDVSLSHGLRDSLFDGPGGGDQPESGCLYNLWSLSSLGSCNNLCSSSSSGGCCI